jgi:hypothetical protein
MESSYHETAEQLLQILDERGIALTSDDILWAFESENTRKEMVAWCEEYLQKETLLSKEEVDLLVEAASNSFFDWDIVLSI